ncbi:Calcineurin-like phosphoesterase [Teratosphaeria destructans]|uniref:Calcineurin-like phosphoesterase n=1 Tax=Teratosphaeria destructans TaxID=418781 RepID=A0A9W7STF8_9PEZI|nr:Calcineurin-like phosphoesterase [Teratosphaeria destructans]
MGQPAKVTIQFMSDLHQERHGYSFTTLRRAPILILGGDIGRFIDYDHYRSLLSRFCAQFELVVLVAGNHEFYGSTRAQGLDAAQRLVEEPSIGGKLRFLNRDRIDLGSNITILGCTLHSHIAHRHKRLTNDFSRILGWSVEEHNEEHKKDLQWLQTSLNKLRQEEAHRRVIVVTHYAPMFKRVSHPLNELNDVSQCFSSTALEDLRRSSALTTTSHWVFGHTHWNVRLKVGKVHVVSNQMHNDHENLTWWQRKSKYAQQLLLRSGVWSVVTGDIALIRYGVDLAVHDIELCVYHDKRELAATLLGAQDTVYKRLPDLQDPDFYHPYKKNATRFQVCDSKAGLELYILTDQALSLDLTDQTVDSTAYDGLAVSVRYPTYKALLQGWLNSACAAMEIEDFNSGVVYMMQAERLVDSQNVDEAWLKEHLSKPDHYLQASILLRGKRRRTLGSSWT